MELLQFLDWAPVYCDSIRVPGQIAYLVSIVVKLVVNIAAASNSNEVGEENSISQCIQKVIDYK